MIIFVPVLPKTQNFMIKYVIQAKKNPIDKTVKYYPQMAPTTLVTLVQIVKRVAKRSTVSQCESRTRRVAIRGDRRLAERQHGAPHGFGSFRLNIKATGFETSVDAKKAKGKRDKDSEHTVYQERGDERGTFALQRGVRLAGRCHRRLMLATY